MLLSLGWCEGNSECNEELLTPLGGRTGFRRSETCTPEAPSESTGVQVSVPRTTSAESCGCDTHATTAAAIAGLIDAHACSTETGSSNNSVSVSHVPGLRPDARNRYRNPAASKHRNAFATRSRPIPRPTKESLFFGARGCIASMTINKPTASTDKAGSNATALRKYVPPALTVKYRSLTTTTRSLAKRLVDENSPPPARQPANPANIPPQRPDRPKQNRETQSRDHGQRDKPPNSRRQTPGTNQPHDKKEAGQPDVNKQNTREHGLSDMLAGPAPRGRHSRLRSIRPRPRSSSRASLTSSSVNPRPDNSLGSAIPSGCPRSKRYTPAAANVTPVRLTSSKGRNWLHIRVSFPL